MRCERCDFIDQALPLFMMRVHLTPRRCCASQLGRMTRRRSAAEVSRSEAYPNILGNALKRGFTPPLYY
jgi:hypothetical protein